MKVLIILTLAIASLAGCSSGGGSNNDPDPAPNSLKQLSSQDANSEAGMIGNAANLRADINALFDSATPVDIEPDESIQDVISRAEGS